MSKLIYKILRNETKNAIDLSTRFIDSIGNNVL